MVLYVSRKGSHRPIRTLSNSYFVFSWLFPFSVKPRAGFDTGRSRFEVVEEWKWRGVPGWSHDGLICTGETYKNVVKVTFAKGAALKDPSRLFNSSLEGNTRRAIDFREGEKINEEALKTLVRAAVTMNKSKAQS